MRKIMPKAVGKHTGWAKYERKKMLEEEIKHYQEHSEAAEYKQSGLHLLYSPMGNKR